MRVTLGTSDITITNNASVTRVVINGKNSVRFEARTVPKFTTELAGYTQGTPQMEIVVVENDRAIDVIKLGKVTNQGTWTNNAAGMENAMTALKAVL